MIRCTNCGHETEGQAKFCPACGTSLVEGVVPGDSLVGTKLTDKYRILDRLGQGSMGTVYLGEHIGLKKKVALKVLHPGLGLTEEILQRFQREGIAAGKFSHPNAIQIFDFDRGQGDAIFLAMEYVDGENLKEFLRRRGKLPVEEATSVARQVLGALSAAHECGIVHRDLKPENIMVAEVPSGLAVKVLDFGLSKLVDVPLGASLFTEPGRIMGTPLYMPPEQGLGDKVDHRSDLYAVGLILHEMLTGQAPFKGDTLREILVKHQTQPAPSLVDSHPDLGIPGDLDDVVLRALEKDPQLRFQSAREMLAAVDSVDPRTSGKRGVYRSGVRTAPEGAVGQVAVARPPSQAAPSTARDGALLKVAILGGLVLTLVAVLAVFALKPFGDRDGAVAEIAIAPLPAPPASYVRVREKPPAERTAGEERYVTLLDEARVGLASGDLVMAFAKVSAAFERPELGPEAYAVRASVYAAREDFDMALADYTEALARDPGYTDAQAAVAWLHYDNGNLDAAREAFDAVTTIDPDSAEALVGAAVLAADAGDLDVARQKLEAAVSNDAQNARAQLYLGRLLTESGEYEAAVEALIAARRADAGSWEALAELGRTYAAQGRLEDAERQFDEALEIEPDAKQVFLDRAALFIRQERWSDVIGRVPAGFETPGMAPARILMAEAYVGQRDYERALAEVERGLAQGADRVEIVGDPDVHVLRGTLLQKLGRNDEAVSAYGRALELEPRSAGAHLNLGLLHFAAERWEPARDSLERAIAADGDSAFAYYALGILCMEHLDEPDQARANFEAYVALGGDDERVSGWLIQLGG